MTKQHITFLPRTALPTGVGFYYARTRGSQVAPYPVEVSRAGRVRHVGNQQDYALDDYEWFGSLPEVREASAGQ